METPTIPPGLSPNEILAWSGAQVQAPDSPVFEQPQPPPPPTGTPTETNSVQWAVKLEDTDIALAATPTNVVVGSVFLIDDEYMTVIDVSNVDNPGVTRATHGSVAAAHDAETVIDIWTT